MRLALVQRFLQEHGEVQLSALGLGELHLLHASFLWRATTVRPCLPADNDDTPWCTVGSDLYRWLACSNFLNGDSGRDTQKRAMGR